MKEIGTGIQVSNAAAGGGFGIFWEGGTAFCMHLLAFESFDYITGLMCVGA